MSVPNIIDFQSAISNNSVNVPSFSNLNDLGNYVTDGNTALQLMPNSNANYGVIVPFQGTVENGSNVVPFRTGSVMQVYQDTEGNYTLSGATQTTPNSTMGRTVMSSISQSVTVASLFMQLGNHISEDWYEGDVDKMPTIIRGNYEFKQWLQQNGYYNGSFIEQSRQKLASDIDLLRSGTDYFIPVLLDTETGKLYMQGDVNALGIRAVLGLIDDYKQPKKEFHDMQIPTHKTLVLHEGGSTYSYTIDGGHFVVVNNTLRNQAHIVTTIPKTVTVHTRQQYDDGSIVEFDTNYYVNTSHSIDGLTCYSRSFGKVDTDMSFITPIRTDLDPSSLETLSDAECVGAFHGVRVLPEGMNEPDNEYHLSDEDIETILDPSTTISDIKDILETSLPFLSTDKLTIPSLKRNESTGDFEETNLDFYPLSYPLNFITTGMYVSQPIDMPITENQPQESEDPLIDMQSVLDLGLGLGIQLFPTSYPDYDPEKIAGLPRYIDPEPDPETETPKRLDPEPKPHDDGTNLPKFIPPSHTGDTGLGGVYNPTKAELGQINSFLWSNSFWDIVEKMIQNPMEAIVGLQEVYFSPTHGATKEEVYCGCQATGVNSYRVTKRFYELDMGTVHIGEKYGNVYDYKNTTISIYLPYIGIVPLDVESVMRADINVKYNIDVCSGASTCNIYVTREHHTVCLYTYGCQVSSIYPLSGRDFTSVTQSLVGAVSSILMANPVGALASGANAIVGATHGNVQQSGGYGGNTGATAIKTPYIIIKRDIPCRPNQFYKYFGYPVNVSVRLGNCSGFSVFKDIKLNTTNMTLTDIENVMNLLNNGVHL